MEFEVCHADIGEVFESEGSIGVFSDWVGLWVCLV